VTPSDAVELSQFVEAVRQDLAIAAEAGGAEARGLADRLTATLESTIRLALLEALSTTADEITRDLAPGSVDVRLRGRDAEFVVSLPPEALTSDQPAATVLTAAEPGDERTLARINLRLPES
jgi:hypothetical protein